jgi:CDP-diacylglycerol---serine O-phosphatidyltransferase
LIKNFLNPPNWFTSASLFCSTYAIATLISADEITAAVISRSCVLVIFGGIFDLLDGRVARLTNRYTEFGVQLDTIADMVGFGLAPAMIVWSWQLSELGGLGMAVTFWFVLCVAFRLARFNVNVKDETWSLAGHTQGLTSTMAGGSLVTAVWVFNGYLHEAVTPPTWSISLFTAALGLLMVSSIPFRNFRDFRHNKVARRIFAVCLSCCLAGGFLFDPSIFWGVGAFLYLVVGVIDGLVTATYQKRLTRALMFEELESVLEEALSEQGLNYDSDEDFDTWVPEHTIEDA